METKKESMSKVALIISKMALEQGVPLDALVSSNGPSIREAIDRALYGSPDEPVYYGKGLDV